MPYYKIVPLVLIALTLTACSGRGHNPPPLEAAALKTDIKDNGLKLFVYETLPVKHSVAEQPTQKSRTNRPPGGGHSQKRQVQSNTNPLLEALTDSIDNALEDTGYCREGYIELDHFSRRGLARIRGECKEGATELDRRLFPNQRDAIIYRI
ncbi:hypothetical protein MIB92_08695 [Aestuariirhabdus sp. Z084]|uniref:hypothetical protein n=1 Tax=Aestuariirhabdus haliotis TaxID=2918751 RepID=UPI00201B3BBE|nr:hypothetical protein [Aestuariirhabdus haliotis]MCL6415727.1 hypothetical protein [Aestuariirhabdus haliotis]MCL6419747.1 hypothetical protein [Aestuariirhabdus haliotis]